MPKAAAVASMIFGSLLAAGCARGVLPEAPAAEPLRASDFYPLAVGNRWTYQVGDGAGAVRRTVQTTGREGAYFVDDAGGRLRVDAGGLRDPHRYLLPDPVAAGHRWSSVQSVRSVERYETVEAGRPCEVPAGTFARCVRVRATNPIDPQRALVNETTYAEGVGLVELRSLQQERGAETVQMHLRLVEFSLQ